MVIQSVSRMQVSEGRLTEQNDEELALILGWMFLTDSVDVWRRGSEDTLEEHWRRGDTGNHGERWRQVNGEQGSPGGKFNTR